MEKYFEDISMFDGIIECKTPIGPMRFEDKGATWQVRKECNGDWIAWGFMKKRGKESVKNMFKRFIEE